MIRETFSNVKTGNNAAYFSVVKKKHQLIITRRQKPDFAVTNYTGKCFLDDKLEYMASVGIR